MKKLFDEMIDYCLLGKTLSEFVKAHFKKLLKHNCYEVSCLWKVAEQKARAIMSL